MRLKYRCMHSNLSFKNSAHGSSLESVPMAYRLNINNHRKNMRFLMLIKNIFGCCLFCRIQIVNGVVSGVFPHPHPGLLYHKLS